MKSKSDVATLVKKQQDTSKKFLSAQRENNKVCRAFYDGDTMDYKDTIQFTDASGTRKRAKVRFNKVQPSVEAVVGFMAQNRRIAKFVARMNEDPRNTVYSNSMNALYEYHRENTNADQLETEQDGDLIICGVGAIETDLSYIVGESTSMPNGELVKARIPLDTLYWDPTARQKNVIDARWAGYYKDYDIDEALSLFEGSDEEDFQHVFDDQGSESETYTYNPYGGRYNKVSIGDTVEWADADRQRVRVYNHQWMEYETFYKAANPVYSAATPEDAAFIMAKLEVAAMEYKQDTGLPDGITIQDPFVFDSKAPDLTFDAKLHAILKKSLGPILKAIPFKRKVFYTAVVSGKHVFSCFKSISQQGFSIKFKTGLYNETKNIWMGLVNAMMEPTDYFNKALTELMFTIAANSKGGVLVEEGAVENIADFERKWAKTDAVIKVNAGTLTEGRLKEKTISAVPTGLENIIQLCDASINQNGIDTAFMGDLNEKEQSGILFKRRIRQCISKLGRYFDALTLFQKESARLDADLIRVWAENNEGATVRILGQDGANQYMEVSSDMLAAEYDVSIQEAPQTAEDKQESAMALGAYADRLIQFNPQGAQVLINESIQMLPLSDDVKARIAQALQPQQDQIDPAMVQQMQAELEQLKDRVTQAQVDKFEQEAKLAAAKAQKELASIDKVAAETAKSLEEAASVGLENDLLRSGAHEPAKVSI